MPGNRRRVITFSALGVIALLAIIFTTLVLWPASAQQPHGGVGVGVPGPTFVLPIARGQGNGTVSLQRLREHPVASNFWSEACQPGLSEVPNLRGSSTQ